MVGVHTCIETQLRQLHLCVLGLECSQVRREPPSTNLGALQSTCCVFLAASVSCVGGVKLCMQPADSVAGAADEQRTAAAAVQGAFACTAQHTAARRGCAGEGCLAVASCKETCCSIGAVCICESQCIHMSGGQPAMCTSRQYIRCMRSCVAPPSPAPFRLPGPTFSPSHINTMTGAVPRQWCQCSAPHT